MGQIHPKDGAEGHRVREPHRQMNYPCWQLSYTLHRFGGGNHPNCRRTVLVHSLMGEHFSREEMGVRFPPAQLIRISVLKLNMERWRNGRRGSYVQYIMFVMLTANITAWGLLHCWFKSNSLQSRRWHKRPYKSIRCATWRGSSDGRAMI